MFDWVESFARDLAPRMKHPYILVTGNSDHTTPTDFPSANRILLDPKCIAWFSQNCIARNHPKLHAMPIGLDYHTLSFPRGSHEWGESGITPLQQEQQLLDIRKGFKPLEETTATAITNFHLAMDSPPRRFFYRQPIYMSLHRKTCVRWLPRQTRDEFWNTCNDFAFVICPFGNGLDTHRTWEVLALGRIPIIPRSPLNVIFEKLPVLEVDNWSDLSEEWLQSRLQEILQKKQNGEYDESRLTLSYWMSRINDLRK